MSGHSYIGRRPGSRAQWCLLVALSCSMGCHRGPDSAAFIQACLTGPRQTGTQENCSCAERVSARLPSEEYRSIVLDMQGKSQEAAAITARLSAQEQAQWIQDQFNVVSQCYPNR